MILFVWNGQALQTRRRRNSSEVTENPGKVLCKRLCNKKFLPKDVVQSGDCKYTPCTSCLINGFIPTVSADSSSCYIDNYLINNSYQSVVMMFYMCSSPIIHSLELRICVLLFSATANNHNYRQQFNNTDDDDDDENIKNTYDSHRELCYFLRHQAALLEE